MLLINIKLNNNIYKLQFSLNSFSIYFNLLYLSANTHANAKNANTNYIINFILE